MGQWVKGYYNVHMRLRLWTVVQEGLHTHIHPTGLSMLGPLVAQLGYAWVYAGAALVAWGGEGGGELGMGGGWKR